MTYKVSNPIVILDDRLEAFSILEKVGLDKYIDISTVDGSALTTFGNTNTNPEHRFNGSGNLNLNSDVAKIQLGASSTFKMSTDGADALFENTPDGSNFDFRISPPNGSGTTFKVGINSTTPQLQVSSSSVTIGTNLQLRITEPSGGSNYSGFQTPAISSNLVYTLPDAFPVSSGHVLSSTTAGVMSWTDGGVTTSDTLTDNFLVRGNGTSDIDIGNIFMSADGDDLTIPSGGKLFTNDIVNLTGGGLDLTSVGEGFTLNAVDVEIDSSGFINLHATGGEVVLESDSSNDIVLEPGSNTLSLNSGSSPFTFLSTGTQIIQSTSSGEAMRHVGQDTGFGTSSPQAKVDVLSTTEQARLSYDVTNFTSLTTDSNGDFTISPSGENVTLTNLIISGNLVVNGSTVTKNAETINLADNHIYLNSGYETVAAETGGLVVNYLPTSLTDAVLGDFTAGVASVSNPTVVTSGSDTFSINDFIQIHNSRTSANDGIYEVLSHVGTLLTIRGVGVTATLDGFSDTQFTTTLNDTATITKTNVTVNHTGTDGMWETGKGSSTPLTFSDFVTIDATQTLLNKSFDSLPSLVILGNLSVVSTTEQLRLSYDVTNFASFTTASDAALTINTSDGTDTGFVTIQPVNGANPSGAGIMGVGVAASAVTASLDVTGNIFGGAALRLRAGDDDTGSQQILFSKSGLNQTHNIRTQHNSSTASSNCLSFYMWDQGTDSNEALGSLLTMTLTGEGNVGINNAAPTEKLDVGGNITYSGLITPLKWKEPVVTATTVDGTDATDFENGDTVGGIVLSTGDRFLRKNQTTGSENGIYTVNASGAPTRATDFDGDDEVFGSQVRVTQGVYVGVAFKLTNTTSPTIGTTALNFEDVNNTENTKNIHSPEDFGVAITAPDLISRVPLITGLVYKIHETITIPRFLLPVVTSSTLFSTITFEVLEGRDLLLDGSSTPHFWGRDVGGFVIRGGALVDIGNSGAGQVTEMYNAVGLDSNSFFATFFVAFIGFKRLGHTVDILIEHETPFFIDNLGGFVHRSATTTSAHIITSARVRNDDGVGATERPMFVWQGSSKGVIISTSDFILASGDEIIEIDTSATGTYLFSTNAFEGSSDGNFFSTSQVIAITNQEEDDIAIASFSDSTVDPGVDTTVTFSSVQDFTREQIILIADATQGSLNASHTIVRVSEDLKSFDVNVTFATDSTANIKRVKHTVATNPFSIDSTVVITDTTNDGTFKITNEDDTSFHTPDAFTAGDLVGTATSTSQDEDSIGVTALVNGAQKDSRAIGSMNAADNDQPVVITTIDVWEDLDLNELAVEAPNNSRFTLTDTSTGELRYDDVNPFDGGAIATLSAASSGGSQEFEFRIVINGSSISGTAPASVEIGGDTVAVPILAPISIVQNDLIRIQVRNIDGTSNLIPINLTLEIQ